VRLVRAVQTVGTDDDTLGLLQQKVEAARLARASQLRAERIATARARMQAGVLLAPPGDNALSILSGVEAEAPLTPGLADAWATLVAALESNTRASISGHDWAAADADVAAIRITGRAATLADTLAREIAAARLQQEYLATAVPASELVLSSFAAPIYPP